MEINKTYEPKEIERKWYKFWEDGGYFRPQENSSKSPFTILIPPPNVTGILHVGHVLNNTLQDVVVRYHRMKGEPTLWLPGVDHAGIATQNMVEKDLAKQGLSRHQIGREKLIELIWKWKNEKGNIIIEQLKLLGASCDWERQRFTMDEVLSKAVKEVFVTLYEQGLIYKGKYIINWCPRCVTALANDEVEHSDEHGKLWHIRYPYKDGDGFVTVATTRPETMLGDTAVAVNPRDERYTHLIGKELILPLTGRSIPVVADEYVDSTFGTGCVKVTPAHDPNDFEIGNRHSLPRILVMDEHGIMNSHAGKDFDGMDRYACREKVLEMLVAQGLLDRTEGHDHAVGHCYRCDTVIEPYLSDQWFVKMKPLAEAAIKAVETGEIKFQPERWTKVYMHWMNNIRDWCISRQIWWGHRIPAYYCMQCGEMIVAKEQPERCHVCGYDQFHQDEDVLDTWFSSWLWPFSTMGWPEETEDLKRFLPTDVLITAPEIIYLWVARMIMSTLHFRGLIPFHTVLLHGTVRDDIGRKMSKSLGNSPDPIDVMDKVGADALRFSMIFNTPKGADVIYSDAILETGRNFANKIWNAYRFIMMNAESIEGLQEKTVIPDPDRESKTSTLEGTSVIPDPDRESSSNTSQPDESGKTDRLKPVFQLDRESNSSVIPDPDRESSYTLQLELADKWIYSRLQEVTRDARNYFESLRLNDAAQLIFQFIWDEFCSWYIELSKDRLYNETEPVRRFTARHILLDVMQNAMRLLHPIMPFITEEIWQGIKSVFPPLENPQAPGSMPPALIIAAFPEVDESRIDPAIADEMAFMQEAISAVRNLRKQINLSPAAEIQIHIRLADIDQERLFLDYQSYFGKLARVTHISAAPDLEKPKPAIAAVVRNIEIFLPLSGLVDLEAERLRLSKQLEKYEKELTGINAKLNNANFLANAKAEVVEKEKEKYTEVKTKADLLVSLIDDLI